MLSNFLLSAEDFAASVPFFQSPCWQVEACIVLPHFTKQGS